MTSGRPPSGGAADNSALARAVARHAWENHDGDFRVLHPPIETEAELADFITYILDRRRPMAAPRGRTIYLDEQTGTVVVVNPRDSVNRGTAFRPLNPDDYVARVVGDIQ